MANLSNILATDPTLEAVNRAMEYASQLEQEKSLRGGSIGMGWVGEPCSRKIWYRFRWADAEIFNAETLKRFEDGHAAEAQQATRLRMVQGITLITHDPDSGQQIGFNDIQNHMRGYLDGQILGILQAPKTWHVWEHKAVGEKSIAELEKLKAKFGEKEALKKWKPLYYAQAILYMHYTGFTRHYMTVSSPGGRSTVSIRTNADEAESLVLINKVARIIQMQNPPERISKTEDFFECRFCVMSDICHKDKQPKSNCRTCLHSTPVENGGWHCAKFNQILPIELQKTGCASHLYIPSLVPGEIIEAGENFVKYRMKDGAIYTNEGE